MNELNKLYNENHLATFSMAVSHLLDVGFRRMEKVTDEDIEEDVEGNGLMTKEFVQDLMRLARDIAKACESPIDIIRFCQKKKVFDVSNIKFE